MKTRITQFVSVLLVVVLGFAAYVRFAPSDPARWNISPNAFGPPDQIFAIAGSASLWAPHARLDQLDAIVMATPRTTRLAGSVTDGRITWITRSAFWGFPDYTTAEDMGKGLFILSRLRFGKFDMGVNAARLRDWQSKL
ncbi:DUF1499 domain-containing protein [Pseudorhodobacter sp.]|uniref:DUF1499 domain-containing protein n=1 Tax=Pseudorhodobacter sp. TaxID=1934400 RepID=UPI0026474001|nr:DUF1499 domain-containing protein [Pseudorhodobacter sp.]MDN5786813.1 DUF1499 domain-containing protein [Pseudorhodobacter sp.]